MQVDHEDGMDTSSQDSERGDGGAPERWVLARSLCVEQIDEAAATIYLRSNGARVRIARALYRVLLQFEQPRTLLEAAGSAQRAERLAGPFARLRAKGFVLAQDEAETAAPRRVLMDAPVRLFDCPAQKLVPARTDVVVLGMPYDFGDRAAAGARNAPQAIREVSVQTLYAIDRRSGRPRGWFDADRGCAILQGVSIADAGDVFVDYGESQGTAFARLDTALERLLGDGAMALLLGGDGSIAWPAIARAQARQPLAVVRIGGPGPCTGDSDEGFVSAASLPQRALRLPGVERWLQIAARGVDAGVPTPRRWQGLSAGEWRRDGAAALAARLPPAQPIYLSLDLSVLAGVGDRLAGGGHARGERFDYPELHGLLCALGAAHPILGLDVVGAIPARPGWNVAAMTALHLVLTALSAAKDRHEPAR